MRQLWPYPPLTPAIESIDFASDVIQAKAAEQRIALRTAPRRSFSYSHTLSTEAVTGAVWRYRDAQADGGFYVPDWAQAVAINNLDSSVDVSIDTDLGLYDFGTRALVFNSLDDYEVVQIESESVGATIAELTANYDSGYLIPLWEAHSVSGLNVVDIGGGLSNISAEFITDENTYYGASDYDQYKGVDVLPICPVLGGGLESSVMWAAEGLDNVQGVPEFFRRRNIPEHTFSMRWQAFTRLERWSLRRWLHARRGRQRSFWRSSFTSDFTPIGDLSGEELRVQWPQGAEGVTRSVPFDIEIVSDVSTYHRVMRIDTDSTGAMLLTLDDPATVTNIQRISILRHSRFIADRIEIEHTTPVSSVQVQCVEVEQEPEEADSGLSST